MINFRCNLIDVCVRLRQFNILSRGLGSKAILASEWMQSSKFSDSGVKICDGSLNSEAIHKLHFQKLSEKGIRSTFASSSVVLIGNGTGTKRQRCTNSCSRPTGLKSIELWRTNQQRFFSTSKIYKFQEKYQPKMNFRNLIPIPFTLFLIPRNELKALEIRWTIDPEFRTKSFLKEAKMAIVYVSGALAEGRFDDLKGLVEDEFRSIIEHNFENMSEQKRRKLGVVENLWFYLALHHIKIIRREQGYVTLEASVGVTFMIEEFSDIPLKPMEVLEYCRYCVYIFRKKVDKTTGEGNWVIHNIEFFDLSQLRKPF